MGNDGPMSGMTPHVAVLANPAARAGRDLDRVLQRLQALGVAPDVLAAGSPAEAIAAAEKAVADGTERLVVVGGDGIVHLAAGALAGSSTALGIIAAGTGNDAARALGLLDGDLGTRVDRALDEPTAIDMISGGDRPAVTNVIIGFPATVNERANRMRMGAARYTVATLLEIPRMRPQPYRLVLDGEARDLHAAVVVVANTAYFGAGMAICPDADPTDGLLDVCVVGDASRVELLRSFRLVSSGRHVGHPKVSMFRAGEVTVEGTGPIRADGEPLGALPVTLRPDRGALLVAGASAHRDHRG